MAIIPHTVSEKARIAVAGSYQDEIRARFGFDLGLGREAPEEPWLRGC